MSNFDPNAILRGAQLTVVGGLPLQNLAALPPAERCGSTQSSSEPRSIQV